MSEAYQQLSKAGCRIFRKKLSAKYRSAWIWAPQRDENDILGFGLKLESACVWAPKAALDE
jgi:hypothetical protein